MLAQPRVQTSCVAVHGQRVGVRERGLEQFGLLEWLSGWDRLRAQVRPNQELMRGR